MLWGGHHRFAILSRSGAVLLVGAARRRLRLSGRLAGGAAGRCGRSWRFPDNSRFHALNGNSNSRFGDRQIRTKVLIYLRILDRFGANRRNFPGYFPVTREFGDGNRAQREFRRCGAARSPPFSPGCAASPGQRGALEPDATIFVDYPEKLQSAWPSRIAAVAGAAEPIGPESRTIARRRSDVGRRRLQHQRSLPRRDTRCRRRLLRLGRQAARASDQRRGDGRPGFSHRRGAGVKAPSASSRRWRRRIVQAARRSAP
jgi:hypothetical protein